MTNMEMATTNTVILIIDPFIRLTPIYCFVIQ